MSTQENTAPMANRLYSIGEVGKLCNVSKKTLRFYDKIDVISPDYISEENNYRYYSKDTVLFVPVIKYYKQMGFKLEEMKTLLDTDCFDTHTERLRDKIDELKKEREAIAIAYTSVNDWYNLIREAKGVIENKAIQVSVKYINTINACYMKTPFDNNYRESVINIDWTNYLEEIGHEITGAVYLCFPNFEEKLNGQSTEAVIFQQGANDVDPSRTRDFGGKMMLSAYHIGTHDTINETYARIRDWADQYGYRLGASSIERYVVDYWTLNRSEDFVTEILVEIDN
ncbi:MAG: MerR family transcriptional regulator [Peptococcaceae bacterium]|nr:MerR family transcriptional regulator [Peptococcaceae bacterium]